MGDEGIPRRSGSLSFDCTGRTPCLVELKVATAPVLQDDGIALVVAILHQPSAVASVGAAIGGGMSRRFLA